MTTVDGFGFLRAVLAGCNDACGHCAHKKRLTDRGHGGGMQAIAGGCRRLQAVAGGRTSAGRPDQTPAVKSTGHSLVWSGYLEVDNWCSLPKSGPETPGHVWWVLPALVSGTLQDHRQDVAAQVYSTLSRDCYISGAHRCQPLIRPGSSESQDSRTPVQPPVAFGGPLRTRPVATFPDQLPKLHHLPAVATNPSILRDRASIDTNCQPRDTVRSFESLLVSTALLATDFTMASTGVNVRLPARLLGPGPSCCPIVLSSIAPGLSMTQLVLQFWACP